MIEFRHYFDRSLVGFILLAVVALTALVVLVPIFVGVVDAVRVTFDPANLRVLK